MKKKWTKLSILFIGILIVKVILSFFINSIFLYPDESCVIEKAFYFAQHFELTSCSNAIQAPAGDPFPLYSILISPLYLLFSKASAFRVTLIFNALLISSLTFPLFHIFKKFLKNEKHILISITFFLFLPQILLYEKTLLTETLFTVLNIWTLHFYLKSFTKSPQQNKTFAILLALLASLTRPFGFITLLAITINEFFISKDKKQKFTFLSITFLSIIAALQLIPGITDIIAEHLDSLRKIGNLKLVALAFINQINSFTISTYLLPLIIFFHYLTQKDSKDLKDIKIFLTSFILLNFLISSQHIYYYFSKGYPLDFLTRYINMSLNFIFLFTIIFIQKNQSFKFTKKTIAFICIAALSLLFLNYKIQNPGLNMELNIFYPKAGGFINPEIFFQYLFLPISFGLCLTFFYKKRKVLISLLTILLVLQSSLTFLWAHNFSAKETDNAIFKYFDDRSEKILFIDSIQKEQISYNFWRIKALTANQADLIIYNDFKAKAEDINQNFQLIKAIKKYDYVVSPYKLDQSLKLTKITSSGNQENLFEVK